jgi:hypothetical protein
VRHLTFALRAVGGPAAVQPLVALLKAGKVPDDQYESCLSLVAEMGAPQDLRLVLDVALEAPHRGKPRPRKAVLLDGLAAAARQRQMRPTGDLNRLKDLVADDGDEVRAAALRLAGLWRVEGLRPQVAELAGGKSTAPAVRQAAFDALVAFADRPAADAVQRLADDKAAALTVRRMAVIALASLDAARAAAPAVEVLAADTDPSPSWRCGRPVPRGATRPRWPTR